MQGGYKQRSAGYGLENYFDVTFTLLQSLDPKQELCVAYGIFQYVSRGFEESQALGDRIKAILPSLFGDATSFTVEDLPSNAISFYSAAFEWDRDAILKKCGCGVKTGKPGKGRNLNFRADNSGWPKEFESLTPEPPGVLWQIAKESKQSLGFDSGAED